MNLDKYEKIDGREALRRLADGETVYGRNLAEWTFKDNGEVVFDGIKECSIAAVKNDIPVALGNDVGCPYITHYDFWREPVYFHMYVGVSNQFALYTATLHNAELGGLGDVTGSIEKP